VPRALAGHATTSGPDSGPGMQSRERKDIKKLMEMTRKILRKQTVIKNAKPPIKSNLLSWLSIVIALGRLGILYR